MSAPILSELEAGPSNTTRKRGRSDSDPWHQRAPPGKMSKPHDVIDNDHNTRNLPGPSSEKSTHTPLPTVTESLLQSYKLSDVRHDDSYYFDDGSCVLLVNNVLFNVGQSPARKDSI